jgi:hypothetical protein
LGSFSAVVGLISGLLFGEFIIRFRIPLPYTAWTRHKTMTTEEGISVEQENKT